ncbi:unnamed protein product [Calypogeia fissa]
MPMEKKAMITLHCSDMRTDLLNARSLLLVRWLSIDGAIPRTTSDLGVVDDGAAGGNRLAGPDCRAFFKSSPVVFGG